ncbi:MAG: hypothetical protein HN867_12670 [Deltaproteobacteria bacterium]|nr:hypothetical protein [Deltaproteobacteria bacterium]
MHYDAGWYGPERAESSNPVTVKSEIDMPDVIHYARERKHSSNGWKTPQQYENEFAEKLRRTS